MPTEYSCYLEPETSSISHRVSSINQFINAGYDVHVNFSPVIVQDGWLEQYELLFRMLNILLKKCLMLSSADQTKVFRL